jgi:hypothetical protein
MTAIADAGAIGASPRSGALPGALGLARVEGVRLVRHPVTVVAALLGTALLVAGTWYQAPVLNRHDTLTTEALLPVAAALLVVAHLASSRSARHATTELDLAAPSSPGAVTTALLLGVSFAALFSLLLVVSQLAYLRAVGGVAGPRLVVVATGPAIVLFGGALGVALGRWAPWPATGPLALLGVVAVSLMLLNSGSLDTRTLAYTLSPYLPSDELYSSVSELSHRPAGSHLVYLLGLSGIAWGAALLRTSRRAVPAALLAIALVVTMVAAMAQTRPPPRAFVRARADFVLEPERHRTCEAFDRVTYCAYRDYTPWIEHWRAPVSSVLDAVPLRARRGELALTQLPTSDELYASGAHRLGRILYRMHRARLHHAGVIHPSLHWGRNGGAGDFELALALEAAIHATGTERSFRVTEADLEGLPRGLRGEQKVGRLVNDCATFGQGRSIVALWLAARSTSAARRSFEEAVRLIPWALAGHGRNAYYDVDNYELSGYQYEAMGGHGYTLWGNRETHYAAQLLDRDEAEVGALIARSWPRLTDPDTTTDQAAAVLGLQHLATPAELARAAGAKRARPASSYGWVPCR